MCSVAAVLLFLVVVQAHAKDSTSNVNDKLAKTLITELLDRIFKPSSFHQNLENCTLGKASNLACPQRAGLRASTQARLSAQIPRASSTDSPVSSTSRPSVVISEGRFPWTHVGDIHYLKAVAPAQSRETPVFNFKPFPVARKSPLLFLPGFGVGSFQFVRNLKKAARHRDAYAMNLLGQGRSWPSQAGLEGLQFSADAWVEQVHTFITQVIREPAYVAGNSLGGFLAAQLAAKHPEDVRGIVLLNAAPFWAFRDVVLGPLWLRRLLWQLSGTLFWDGRLPAPSQYKSLTNRIFDLLRNESNVRRILELVYADPAAISPMLVQDIVNASSHPVGPDAFASIVFSPHSDLSFADALQAAATYGVKFLMLYGRDDPWIVPLYGQRAYFNLERGAAQSTTPVSDIVRYLEISPAGHCPHDEAPETVAQALEAWFRNMEVGAEVSKAAAGTQNFSFPVEVEEDAGRIMRVEDVGGKEARNPSEWAGTFLMRKKAAARASRKTISKMMDRMLRLPPSPMRRSNTEDTMQSKPSRLASSTSPYSVSAGLSLREPILADPYLREVRVRPVPVPGGGLNFTTTNRRSEQSILHGFVKANSDAAFRSRRQLLLAGSILSLSALATLETKQESNSEPCCISCLFPKVRHYDIDHLNGNCGECCMDPEDKWLYKLFEPGLRISDFPGTCELLGYTKYQETVKHGFGRFKIVVDLYGPGPPQRWHSSA